MNKLERKIAESKALAKATKQRMEAENKVLKDEAEKRATAKENRLKEISSNEMYKYNRWREKREKNSKKSKKNIKKKTDAAYNTLLKSKDPVRIGKEYGKKRDKLYADNNKLHDIIHNSDPASDEYKDADTKLTVAEKFLKSSRTIVTCSKKPIKIEDNYDNTGFFRKLFGFKSKTRDEILQERIDNGK